MRIKKYIIYVSFIIFSIFLYTQQFTLFICNNEDAMMM
jgi:hypothetical protein